MVVAGAVTVAGGAAVASNSRGRLGMLPGTSMVLKAKDVLIPVRIADVAKSATRAEAMRTQAA